MARPQFTEPLKARIPLKMKLDLKKLADADLVAESHLIRVALRQFIDSRRAKPTKHACGGR